MRDPLRDELHESLIAEVGDTIARLAAPVIAFCVRVWYGGHILSWQELREQRRRRRRSSWETERDDAAPAARNAPGGWNRQRSMLVSAFAAIYLLGATLYQVQPEETGVVIRFGRFDRTTEPGLRMKLPLIEHVYKVPVQRQLKQEFGFRTDAAGVRTTYVGNNSDTTDEAMMLTGDLNVAVVEWIVQYRPSDPYRYLFRVRNHASTLRDINEAVMRQVVGDRTVTEVLTVGRQEIEATMQTRLQEKANQYEMGITIDQVVLQDVNPPDPVKPSWDEVNQAQQQRDRMINEARAEYNRVIPRARGEAEQTVLQAEGYALDRINRAAGEATRFESVEAAYATSPRVTRQRLYMETMQRILPRIGRKLYVDDEATGLIPLLSIDGSRAPEPR